MAQHDYIISNQGFASYRSDHNSSLSAIVSNNSGATEPSTTYAYQWWYDETTDILKMRNADNDAWITMFTFDQTADTYSLATDVELTITENLDLTGSATISGDLTVDTDTLKVDTTNNRVGVKNASPTVELDVTGEAKISGDLTVDTDTLYVDSSNNRVGIGTSSPSTFVHARTSNAGADVSIRVQNDSLTANSRATVSYATPNGTWSLGSNRSGGFILDTPASGEALRVDNSGNLLVGTTDTDPSNDTSGTGGIALGAGSYISLARANSTPLLLNRIGTDGENILFKKNGTTVGSIGNNGVVGYFNFYDAGNVALKGSTNSVAPATVTGADRDNTIDLGRIDDRFDDIYATNGTIQTSDQNEKQSIQSLTASEMAVAQRISKLFKTFKFNSAVEEKGDNARTHTGIIAQDVQQAFADEGLDAGNYALFISSTWWEKEISVDAVAPQEAVYETQTDEEGNEIQVLVQEALEGKDAYTYIDTKEEATEGYTERTRLGIRYPELLSFVSSAFEQRLTNIETRLTALEA